MFSIGELPRIKYFFQNNNIYILNPTKKNIFVRAESCGGVCEIIK